MIVVKNTFGVLEQKRIVISRETFFLLYHTINLHRPTEYFIFKTYGTIIMGTILQSFCPFHPELIETEGTDYACMYVTN